MAQGFTPKPGRLMELGFGILRRSTDYILIVEVREVMRFHHYSLSTEKSYAMKYIHVFHPSGQLAAVQIYILSFVNDTSLYHYCSRQICQWILRYIRFNDRKHPEQMGQFEIERFLSHLAMNRDVSASTQNQALNAILFFYKVVLKISIDAEIRAIRSTRPKRLPTVLSRKEVAALFNQMGGKTLLMFRVMYAGGLRVM